MLILAVSALAESRSTSFNTEAGGWTGGTLGGGVLSVVDGEVSLAPGDMESFTLTARVRLAEGTALTFRAGTAAFEASYEEDGGLSFDSSTAPLPLDEQEWTPDATAVAVGGAPAAVWFGESVFLVWETADGLSVASSTDGATFEEAGILPFAGTAPDAIADGGELTLFYVCATAICRATSDDGVTFTEQGAALTAAEAGTSALDAPSVAVRDDGTWSMWFTDVDTGGTATAVSDDGADWIFVGGISSDDSRFRGLDVDAHGAGSATAWEGTDGINVTPGDSEGVLASSSYDRLALEAGFAVWSPDAPAAPSIVRVGNSWTLWSEGRDGDGAVVGRAVGVPVPGTWVGLVVRWDGTVATADWGEGARLETPLTAADELTLGAAGVLEIDEAQLVYEPIEGDTGDSGDTGETGDTADSGDTGGLDSADTGTGPTFNASELSGEPGGWGCAVSRGSLTLYWLALVAGARRRR